MTVLGYLPPMHMDSDLLIDGGYTNNLPVDVCRDHFSPRFIIGHDIETKGEPHLQNISNFGDSLNGWWLLWRRFCNLFYSNNSFKLPSYTEIISSLIYMNHNRAIKKYIDDDIMDVYVIPELGDTKMLDYHKMEDVVAIGHENAKAPMRAFRLENSDYLPPIVDRNHPEYMRIAGYLSGRFKRSRSAGNMLEAIDTTTISSPVAAAEPLQQRSTSVL